MLERVIGKLMQFNPQTGKRLADDGLYANVICTKEGPLIQQEAPRLSLLLIKLECEEYEPLVASDVRLDCELSWDDDRTGKFVRARSILKPLPLSEQEIVKQKMREIENKKRRHKK